MATLLAVEVSGTAVWIPVVLALAAGRVVAGTGWVLHRRMALRSPD